MIEIARYPWPYRAMLAICSDLDETPDGNAYLEYARYLNTRELTRAGYGLGLEVGNTLFFDMAPGAFSYWNGTAAERANVRALIRSGHIDCFHSFGDEAKTRADARRNLDELAEHDCQLKVWVDHAIARSNLGADIMQGRGDVPSDPAYHADLTIEHGVRYVWMGRVSSCMGQNTCYSPWTSLSQRIDTRAILNTARDAAKVLRGYAGDPKYRMHAGNALTRPFRLRDGQPVVEFIRCNPNPHGVSVGDNTPGIPAAINPATLGALVTRAGCSILYTHLGKGLSSTDLVPPATRRAFELLAQYQEAGKILVTTTRRLLDYQMMRKQVSVTLDGNRLTVSSHGECLDGLSLTGVPPHVRCFVDGREVDLKIHRDPAGGPDWLVFPWKPLAWPL